ncbi:MAG TPA: beta-glucosidase, partial [Rhizomicrobium sp.]|nr:beta-glucosidase [Rhizomicrobium sp.]
QMSQDDELLLVKGYFGADTHQPWIKTPPAEYLSQLPGTAGFVPGIPRLGIPALRESDAGVGIANNAWLRPGDTATAYPSGIANAATWNPQIAFNTGVGIGTEARDRGFNVMLDGGINLAREPRNGRTFEYGGEDPLLAGIMVGAQIKGIQSQHVISTIKHYALNDQEGGRTQVSAEIDEGAARESDLLAFEIGIEHGSPGAVMCSYNLVGGIYACENDLLLNRILKGDWGYTGWVLSDWGAVHSTVAAANDGLDQESAAGFDRQEYFGAPLKAALTAGTVTPARLHDMVHRILRTMFADGLIDFPAVPQKPSTHADVAQASAEEAIVLLKNDGNILPLAATVRKIAIIGGNANLGMLSGGGSSQVSPIGFDNDHAVMLGGGVIVLPNGAKIMPLARQIFDPPSPLAAISAIAPQAQVSYSDGTDPVAAATLAAQSDVVIVFASQWMSEGYDVANLSLSGNQDALIAAVAAANPHTIVVLETGGAVLMPWLDKVPAVLETWYGGSGGATALARILSGQVDPSGRLPITFPQSEAQLPQRTPMGGPAGTFRVAYPEGSDIGYRWYDTKKLTPLFPFGFGLTYTNFGLTNFSATGGDNIAATATVTNTGDRAGSEVVELYVTPPGEPARLVGWSKVKLAPGESQTVQIAAEPRLLARFDAQVHVWRTPAGPYAVSLRRSATDIVSSTFVTVTGGTMKP